MNCYWVPIKIASAARIVHRSVRRAVRVTGHKIAGSTAMKLVCVAVPFALLPAMIPSSPPQGVPMPEVTLPAPVGQGGWASPFPVFGPYFGGGAYAQPVVVGQGGFQYIAPSSVINGPTSVPGADDGDRMKMCLAHKISCGAHDVPEPSSLAVLGVGLIGIGLALRLRRA